MKHVELIYVSLRIVLTEWKNETAELSVLAFLPESEKEKLTLLQGVCKELGIPLFGGIFPGLIVHGTFANDGVLLVNFAQRIPATILPEIDERGDIDARRISHSVIELLDVCADSILPPTLFLIFDCILPNIGSLLEGLYSRLADRVSYAGANAGSETFSPMPCVFNESQVFDRGLLAFLLPFNSTTVLMHGYRHSTRSSSATATRGNRISMIDWQPAFTVYQGLIKEQYGIELTKENFYEYGVHFPFGMLRANSELIVRVPVGLEADGTLRCVGEVPENSILVLLKAPAADQDGCIGGLAHTLENENGSLRARRLMTFYCAGRHKHLGIGAQAELNILKQATGVDELFGALSQGEIGSTQIGDYPMYHNATLVCTPWGAS